MRVAHQGVPVANLPGVGGLPPLATALPGLFQPAPPAAPAAAPIAPAAANPSTSATAAATGSVRPAPIDRGLDGWFLERLFGRR